MNRSALEANELTPFLPHLRTTCNDGVAVAPNDSAWPVRVTTPSARWAYALAFPVSPPCRRDVAAAIDVEVTVERGEVGMAFLDHEGRLLCEAFQSEADGRAIATVHLRSLARCGSLVFRNASQDGRSEATIHRITASAGAAGAEPPIVRVAETTFGRYGQWSGRVPAGFMVDWLGIITHQDFDDSLRREPNATMIAQDWDAWPELPIAAEMTLDWVPLLEAVERAAATFTAVALGAGWGRWIVAGAVAAKRSGRDYRIVGVEAEPSHFEWMERHFRDNHIDLQRARAIHAAASTHAGTCWFMTGDSANWFGQSIVAAESVPGADSVPLWGNAEIDGRRVQRVPCTDLVEVTAGLDQVDYLHLDIQGSEADVLLAHPALLDDRVACINVGTHSEVIERRLRTHFAEHGWRVDLDIPMNGSIRLQVGEGPIRHIAVGDGVQLWLNPRRVDVSGARGIVVPRIISG